MKTHRVPRVTAALSAAMASLLTLTACGSAPSSEASSDEAATRAAPASGVDVFKGVLLGSGPVAAKLSIWSPEARAQAATLPASVQIAKLESAIPKMKAAGWSEGAIARAEKALQQLRQGGAMPQIDETTRAEQEDFVVAQLAKTDPTFFQRFGVEMQSGDPVRVEAAFKEARTLLQAMAPNTALSSAKGGDGDSGPLVVYIFIAVAIFAFWGFTGEADTRLANDKVVLQLSEQLRAR
jgi:hypothetical protein